MGLLATAMFPACMVAAAWSDLRSMTIPNALQLVLVGGFVVAGLLAGVPAAAFVGHAMTALVVLVATFGCFAAGWMGGGDAKLIAATALWLGPTPFLVEYLLTAAAYGGVLTIALLAFRAAVSPTTGLVFLDRLLGKDVGIPYGIALGPAGMVVFAGTPWMAPLGSFLP